jgi:hypothetical protein
MKQPPDDINSLKSQEAELERQLREIRERRAAAEKRPASAGAKGGGRPLRDVTLDMLQDAQCPLNSLLLVSVIRPLHGRTIPSTRFGTMSIDESTSFASSRTRPVYLCHGLTHDHGQVVKRFWARSDWPLAERIIGPMTGRILFLKGAAWTIKVASLVHKKQLAAVEPEKLNYVAADQARDAGISVKRGDFPYEIWLQTIAEAIARHDTEDRALREKAAAELSQRLTEREQLFGARACLVSLPGSNKNWRSARDDG